MQAPLKRRSDQRPFGPKSLADIQRQWEMQVRARAQRKVDVSVIAANIRRELQEGPAAVPPPPPPPPPPRSLSSKAGKKKIADAQLLLLLARSDKPPKITKYRCGACVGCMRHECGACGNCRDKKRFGGPGSRKQACSERRCLYAHEALH
jgi:hypothetical protein